MHEVLNITEIAFVVLGVAGCGLILQRLKQPASLGYVWAGIIFGPSFLSLIENRTIVNSLVEVGALMLLFLIGIELSLRSFRQICRTAFQCAILQVLGCFCTIYLISFLFNWALGTVLMITCIVALSSTAISVKMLKESEEIYSKIGRLTIGILIAQSLLVMPMLLIAQGINGAGCDIAILVKTILSIVILLGLVLYLSRKERIHLSLLKIASSNNVPLPLLILLFCFGAASLSGVVGFSAPYGAFLAGLVLGNTTERQHIIRVTHPVQSLVMMIFFVSVGLLLDIAFLHANLMHIFLLLIIFFVCKMALHVGILRLLGQGFFSSFLSSLFLAQLGEFSLLLTRVGCSANLLSENDAKLLMSLAVLSLALSPLWMIIARYVQKIDHPFLGFWETMGTLPTPGTQSFKFLVVWSMTRIKNTKKYFTRDKDA